MCTLLLKRMRLNENTELCFITDRLIILLTFNEAVLTANVVSTSQTKATSRHDERIVYRFKLQPELVTWNVLAEQVFSLVPPSTVNSNAGQLQVTHLNAHKVTTTQEHMHFISEHSWNEIICTQYTFHPIMAMTSELRVGISNGVISCIKHRGKERYNQ